MEQSIIVALPQTKFQDLKTPDSEAIKLEQSVIRGVTFSKIRNSEYES